MADKELTYVSGTAAQPPGHPNKTSYPPKNNNKPYNKPYTMLNFDYLKLLPIKVPDIEHLHALCEEVEVNQWTKPMTSAMYARNALEWSVKLIYKLEKLPMWSDTMTLNQMIKNSDFEHFIGNGQEMAHIDYVRKIGNHAHHGDPVSKQESYLALINIYNLTAALMKRWGLFDTVAPFNPHLVPKDAAPMHAVPAGKTEPTIDSATVHHTSEPLQVDPISPEVLSEAETRRIFIDMMLREAGWEVLDQKGLKAAGKACVEIEVDGMPTESGKGYVDYVLFGKNGKPLAIIEAKRTTVGIAKGQQQAKLYADCLEKEYGVRPIIYVSNGFHTEVLDGIGYPSRPVYSFHSFDDLVWMMQKRGRALIRDMNPKSHIAGRDYQQTAVKAVCEHLNKMNRHALLVMATGTGKTRTAASLIEILKRNDWVKNVLFLADRSSLVLQAARAFKALLPEETSCILSDDKNPDMNARIMFSTYQTMINYVDRDSKKGEDRKPFSVGRFDLIIIDEAHRSVYGSYTAIFDYFDALLVGLTATPRNEVEHDTYSLFHLEKDEPTSCYELEQAIDDKYLVGYKVLPRHSKVLESGIKYDQLTKAEKQTLEQVWEYEKVKKMLDPKAKYSRDINSQEIFKYLFNEDTINKVLDDLMDNGLKVESGDKLGKTIIFAYNHKHAEEIVRCFRERYSELAGQGFCHLIDNYVNYAQTLIDDFSVRDGMPQIAVSVDMLDTGIDVPEILNLVFFKPVHSKVKFSQMIGRGTRLCANLFGAGVDKQEFYIFDYCNVFEYFSMNAQQVETPLPASLTQRLFEIRVDVAHALQAGEYQTDAFCKGLHDELKTLLRGQVEKLNESKIRVRKAWDLVYKFKQEAAWVVLSEIDKLDLQTRIAPLLEGEKGDEGAKLFDLMCLQVQLSLVNVEYKAGRSKNKIVGIAEALEKVAAHPDVMKKLAVIQEVQQEVFWENASMGSLERVRTELRDLISILRKNEGTRTFVINVTDVIETGEATEGIQSKASYRKRVIEYLRDNKDLPVISKIFNLEQLTPADVVALENIFYNELGTKEEYERLTAQRRFGSIAAFIRSIINIDRDVAMEKYRKLIRNTAMTSQQELYLKNILEYVCTNGDIEKKNIGEDPLRRLNWTQTFGTQLGNVAKFVDELHGVIQATGTDGPAIRPYEYEAPQGRLAADKSPIGYDKP